MEAAASGDTPADSHPHPRRPRLRAVVLRPGAVPVDRVRRPAAPEARGLSLHRSLHGGDAAGRRVRRPDLGGVRRQGEVDRALEQGRLRGRGHRARQPIRADSRQHAGHSALENAPRRDLRRAHTGIEERAVIAGGGQPAAGTGGQLGAARRGLPHLRQADASELQGVDAGLRGGAQGARRGLRPGPRGTGAVLGVGEPRAPHPGHAAARGTRAGPQRRGRVPGTVRAPGAAPQPDPELRPGVLDDGPAQSGPGRRRSGSCRRSSARLG